MAEREIAIPNQKQHWEHLHRYGDLEKYSDRATSFAVEVLSHLPKNGRVLELGCGEGNDAVFFVQKNLSVIATDFSETVIRRNRQRHNDHLKLGFEVVDIKEIFPFMGERFDVVYARQSLQFFDDSTTKKIFGEIHRVLKVGGLLCFSCRSTNDPLLYGKGERMAKDTFLEDRGEDGMHLRHFFSEEYTRQCLRDKFETILLQDVIKEIYGDPSGTIETIAQKV